MLPALLALTTRPLRLLAAAVLLAVLPTGCAFQSSRIPPHAALDELWQDYSALSPPRALAVAGLPSTFWVAGAAGGAASQRVASEQAMEECHRKRQQRRMQAPCQLYATGDEIVWPLD